MTRRLILYGASYPDVVKLIAALNRANDPWEVAGFIDDAPEKQGTVFMGSPIIGTRECLRALDKQDTWYFTNVYRTTVERMTVARRLMDAGCRFATLVHPGVDCAFAQIGADTFIGAAVTLGANVRIGNHCAVRSHSIVNHDSVLEDGVFVGPGVTFCSRIVVRSGAYIGAGSTIREDVLIGEGSMVAAGAVVLHDVPPGTRVGGVPAVELRGDRVGG